MANADLNIVDKRARQRSCSDCGPTTTISSLRMPCCAGAHDIDEHFRTAPFGSNLPVMMGLLGVWNSTFLGHSTRAILPYAQALSKLAPHIQQVLLL